MHVCHPSPAQRLQPLLLLPPQYDRQHVRQTKLWPIRLDKMQLCVYTSLGLAQHHIKHRSEPGRLTCHIMKSLIRLTLDVRTKMSSFPPSTEPSSCPVRRVLPRKSDILWQVSRLSNILEDDTSLIRSAWSRTEYLRNGYVSIVDLCDRAFHCVDNFVPR